MARTHRVVRPRAKEKHPIMQSVTLPDGYIDVPPGKIASIQTFLEMHERPSLRPEPPELHLQLQRITTGADRYLALYHRVGDAHLWLARLEMPRHEVEALLRDPAYETYAVERDGSFEGLVELDFRCTGECELRYFGLTDKLVGTGAGRFAMNRAIELAWSRPITRFWVHTSTLDHPSALAFYCRSGFVPFCRKVEIADDPRLTGIVPKNAAPNVPIV